MIPKPRQWAPVWPVVLLLAIFAAGPNPLGTAIIVVLLLVGIVWFGRWLLVEWAGAARPVYRQPPPDPHRAPLTDEEYVERRAWR